LERHICEIDSEKHYTNMKQSQSINHFVWTTAAVTATVTNKK